MFVDELEAIVLDFDGVLTDNRVWVDEDGRESVRCNRADGLAFDVLRTMELQLLILSTETNPVVRCRGKKLQVPVYQGTSDKVETLTRMASELGFDLKRTLYVGNDLNDYEAMKMCGTSACPSDSHPRILQISDIVLQTPGGGGVMREVVEQVLALDPLEYI